LEVLRGGAISAPFDEISSSPLEIRVPAPSKAIGDVVLSSDMDELTVYLGEHTHCHFSLYMYDDRPASEAIEKVVQETVAFLEDLLADQIVVWSIESGQRGGTFRRDAQPQRLEPAARAYLWSGAPFIPASARGGA
jgi:hypothetical protein